MWNLFESVLDPCEHGLRMKYYATQAVLASYIGTGCLAQWKLKQWELFG